MLNTVKKIASKKKEDDKKAKIEAKESKGSLASRVEFNPEIKTDPENSDGDSAERVRLPESEEFAYLLEDAIDLEDLVEMLDGDLADIDDHEDEINEAISVSQRLKRRAVIRRNKAKIQIKRRRAMQRRATQRTVQKRARRMAVSRMKKRYTHNQKKLSYSERARVEKIIHRRRPAVSRLSRKLVRTVRSNETRRLHNSVEYPEVDVLFEVFNAMWDAVQEERKTTTNEVL